MLRHRLDSKLIYCANTNFKFAQPKKLALGEIFIDAQNAQRKKHRILSGVQGTTDSP